MVLRMTGSRMHATMTTCLLLSLERSATWMTGGIDGGMVACRASSGGGGGARVDAGLARLAVVGQA